MTNVVPLFTSSEVPGARPDRVLGRTIARRYTPPLVVGAPGPCGCGCALTPENSYGFAVVEFAEVVLRAPLDPWQRWVVIHAGEMVRDFNGQWRPRFRRLVLLVARQNGKSHLLVVLALFWLFVQRIPLVLGTSNLLEYAKEAMVKAHSMALEVEEVADLLPRRGLRGLKTDNNDPSIRTAEGCRYKVSAATGNAGRSLTVHRWICDETLKHYDWACYNSAYNAMQAVENAQAWFIGSQGDDRSVLLDSLHKAALPYAEGGAVDETGDAVGLFEYSAPERAETDDPAALASANPNMNRRGLSSLVADAKSAKAAGGQAETGFRTEAMCIRVKNLDPAVDAEAWDRCAAKFDMPKDRRVGVLDVSGDNRRATLAVARSTPGGKIQVAIRQAWDGPDALKRMRAELPGIAKSTGLRKLGFMPMGPAAGILPVLQKGRQVRWPAAMELEPITAEVAALCMGFAEQVEAGEIEHLAEELLDLQVKAAAKKAQAGRWVFDYNKGIHLDAAYAAAGAVHLARMLPAPVRVMNLVGPDDDD